MIKRTRLSRSVHVLICIATFASTWHGSSALAADGQLALVRDDEIEANLHKLSDPIFETAGIPPRNVNILLVNDKEINAFSYANQVMGMNTGTIMEAESPSELRGVIAHETGHMAGGHTARSGDFDRVGRVPFVVTLGLGILAALAGAPDAAGALMMSSGYFANLNQLAYSREQESRADQAAITFLERLHLSGVGMVSFFDRFRYEEVFSEARKYKYFQTHPISSERVEAIRHRVETQPSYGVPDKPEEIADLLIMQAKLRAFMDPPEWTLVKYPASDRSFPAEYARCIAHYRAGDLSKAIREVDALISAQEDNPYLFELKGQILFENGRSGEAIPAYDRAVELRPKSALLNVGLAQSLLATGSATDRDHAISALKVAVNTEADNNFAWSLLAQAYDSKGDEGQARLAIAEAKFALGDLVQARAFAIRSLKFFAPGTTSARRAMDIVLTSNPTPAELESIKGGG
jgi:predicted Zn-dependent protease